MRKQFIWILALVAGTAILGGCDSKTSVAPAPPTKEEAFAFPAGPPKDMTAVRELRPVKAGDRVVYLSEFTARRSEEDYPRKFFSYRFIETTKIDRGGKKYVVVKDSAVALKEAKTGEVTPPQVGKRWYHDPMTAKLLAFENPPAITEMMVVSDEVPFPNQMTAGTTQSRSVTLTDGKKMEYKREIGGLTKAGSLKELLDAFEVKETETLDGKQPIETTGLYSPSINAWVHFKRKYESGGYQWEESGALVEHFLAP